MTSLVRRCQKTKMVKKCIVLENTALENIPEQWWEEYPLGEGGSKEAELVLNTR